MATSSHPPASAAGRRITAEASAKLLPNGAQVAGFQHQQLQLGLHERRLQAVLMPAGEQFLDAIENFEVHGKGGNVHDGNG